jgi:thiamine biosynthesis protein ThiS
MNAPAPLPGAFFMWDSALCIFTLMRIIINGKKEESPNTLIELLTCRNIDQRHVVAELNGSIVPKESFASVNFSEGDILELIQFVGGG